MPHLTPQLKHHILLQLPSHPHASDFQQLAELHGIRGGRVVVWRWWRRWKQNRQPLQRKAGTGKAPLLTPSEVSRYIRAPILAANRSHRAIHYPTIHKSLQCKTGKEVSLRTVRRYGKEQLRVKQKRTTKRTTDEMSVETCEAIAKIRRKAQRVSKSRVMFGDEVHVRLSEAPTSTLVLPGEKQYVVATETSSYSKRFDMIAFCTGTEVLLPKIFTPAERASADVRGINQAMLLQFIDDTLAQAVEGLGRYPITLVLDRSGIHNPANIVQAFADRSSNSITEVLLMPPAAAKRLSPLDNSIFHDWKERVRQHCPLTLRQIQQVMADEWNNITADDIQSHYYNCGLMRGTNVYFDCPDPAGHRHSR